MKSNFNLYLFLSAMILSTLACAVNVGGPEYTAQPIAIQPGETQSLNEMIEQAMITGVESGVITLTITESQLTTFIAEKIAQQPNPPFTEPQIVLRNGQMLMYGKITQGYFTANMLITMNVTLDELTGEPRITIASADFGPIPAPEGVNSAINAVIAEAFTGSFGPVAVGFRLQTITIADGLMTVTGRIK